MKRITFADVPEPAMAATGWSFRFPAGATGDRYQVIDVWRDPRSGIAITVVVDGPTGRTWLANPGCEGKR